MIVVAIAAMAACAPPQVHIALDFEPSFGRDRIASVILGVERSGRVDVIAVDWRSRQSSVS